MSVTTLFHFLIRSSFHQLHPKKKNAINFDTFWTLFLHAPCSSPTLTHLSPSSITTVQQQPPLFPPSRISQSVRSIGVSHYLFLLMLWSIRYYISWKFGNLYLVYYFIFFNFFDMEDVDSIDMVIDSTTSNIQPFALCFDIVYWFIFFKP